MEIVDQLDLLRRVEPGPTLPLSFAPETPSIKSKASSG